MSLPSSPAPAQGCCRHNHSGPDAAIPEATMLPPSPGAATEPRLWLYISDLKSAPFSFWKKNLQKQCIFNTEVCTENRTRKCEIKIGVQNEIVWNMETQDFCFFKLETELCIFIF